MVINDAAVTINKTKEHAQNRHRIWTGTWKRIDEEN